MQHLYVSNSMDLMVLDGENTQNNFLDPTLEELYICNSHCVNDFFFLTLADLSDPS